MYTLIPTNQFKKDLKLLKKRSEKNAGLIISFLEQLAKDEHQASIKNIVHINFQEIIKTIGKLILSLTCLSFGLR